MRPRLAQQPTMSSPIQPALPGILVALPEELGSLAERRVETKRAQGLEVLVLELEGGFRALACVGGVGKVMAARAAALLFSEGADGLLVCGVGGGVPLGLSLLAKLTRRRTCGRRWYIRDARSAPARRDVRPRTKFVPVT